ncbi:MAG: 4-hydroxy-tetrahydrodipicolinate reductase [Culicoidibacterales bacterium]
MVIEIAVNGHGAMASKVKDAIIRSQGCNFVGFCSENEQDELPTLATLRQEHRLDVVIDFSHPDQLAGLLKTAAQVGTGLLLATTGYTNNQLEQIAQAATTCPILQTYNTSIGIAAVEKAVATLAHELVGFETDILEIHHNKKIDAPSGTALKLQDAVLAGRGVTGVQTITNRVGNPRQAVEQIGMQSLRLGNVYGEHSVFFAKGDEVIEVKHTALSKELFAAGAVDLALKLAKMAPGLYVMGDFLR